MNDFAGDPPRRRTPQRGRPVLAYALTAVLLVLGVFFGIVTVKMVKDRTSFFDSMGRTIANIPVPQAVFSKDRIYVLLLGIDYNYDDKGMPYSKGARSDTIMVAGLDFPTKSMKMVSVLRDTEANVNGHDAKINEAYAEGGEPLSDKIVGDFLGMPATERGTHFDRYVIVKINAIKDFINAIGGIDVPVTQKMDYDDSWGHLHIHFKPGLVHMNGEQAQGYMRFRHDACSDPCRTKRQQQVIHLAIQKLKAQKLNDLAHISDLIGVMQRDVETNMTTDEIKSLAWAFRDASNADLGHADTIGYVSTKDTAYSGEVLVPDDEQRQKLVASLLGPYGNVTPAPASALAAVDPSRVHLAVQNGSGVPGLAGVAAKLLKKDGYKIDSVGNADAFSYDATQIRPATTAPYVGERVARDLGLPTAAVTPATDKTPGPAPLVTVIVGKDFAQAQTAAAASPAP